jgi:hypothetical protein
MLHASRLAPYQRERFWIALFGRAPFREIWRKRQRPKIRSNKATPKLARNAHRRTGGAMLGGCVGARLFWMIASTPGKGA